MTMNRCGLSLRQKGPMIEVEPIDYFVLGWQQSLCVFLKKFHFIF